MPSPHALVYWDADTIASWERAEPGPGDDPRARCVLLSPAVAGHDAVEIIPSWAAETPPGTWVELQTLAAGPAAAAAHLRVARWDGAVAESRRTSFEAQRGPAGHLATDTVVLSAPAASVRARVLLCAEPGAATPTLTGLALALTGSAQAAAPAAASSHQPSALALPLLLSQYLSYPDYGHLWCSPTCLAMVLAYWHERTGEPRLAPFLAPESVPATIAPMVYDPGWEGTGNWAFNTAFATTLGLTAYVARIHSLDQLARWTAAGVPVPISISWRPGELDGANGSSSGHITIVTGFSGGQVLMAEPAARSPATIRRSYRAEQLFACWQRASRGVAYLIHPPGWPTPRPGPGDGWV